MAREQRCAILIVHHMNKSIGQKAINRAVGSVDIVGAARSVLLVARTERERPDERILAQVKCNIGPTGNAIVFSVGNGRVKWMEETSRTADEVLGNAFSNIGRPDTQMQQAKDALLYILTPGPKPQREIMERMRMDGIGESTVKKAKQLLEIRSFKQGVVWFWALSEKDEIGRNQPEGSPEGSPLAHSLACKV